MAGKKYPVDPKTAQAYRDAYYSQALVKERIKAYQNANKEHLRIKANERLKVRYATDPTFRQRMSQKAARRRLNPINREIAKARRRLRNALTSIASGGEPKTTKLVGCGWQDLKRHFENLFSDGLGWSSMDWEVDHIIPLWVADSPDDVTRLNCLENIRPASRKANKSKGGEIPPVHSWPSELATALPSDLIERIALKVKLFGGKPPQPPKSKNSGRPRLVFN